MKDTAGKQIHVGDRVSLWNNTCGTVVYSIDTGEYDPSYPAPDWSYLGKGILVMSEEAGLIYYEEAKDNLTVLYGCPEE